MLEALWSVNFESNSNMFGNGVAVVETGKILGGDSTMIYIGKYRVENGIIHSEINVNKYASIPGMLSVVGLDSFNIIITGKSDPNCMNLSGHVVEDPSRKITFHLIRRAELPNP